MLFPCSFSPPTLGTGGRLAGLLQRFQLGDLRILEALIYPVRAASHSSRNGWLFDPLPLRSVAASTSGLLSRSLAGSRLLCTLLRHLLYWVTTLP